MRITLNGDPFDVAGPLTIAELLATLDIDPLVVAVEHNRHIVKRGGFDATRLQAGDQLEIVNFVGGG
ncbi:MAG: sulfur carrier protein ThiS [Acidobacteria bacterium]|nr:sulfur carrier protein ThiS [Acidobacteriota bacterium]